MRHFEKAISLLLLAFVAACVAACEGDKTTSCCTTGDVTLRVVNAFTTSVDVLVDGHIAVAGLAPGAVATASPAPGNHTVVLRSTGTGGSVSQSVTAATG